MSEAPPVDQLVPHEAPMLALDELVDHAPGWAVARMRVRDDLIFVRDGRLDSVTTLEYMAQTVAACLGAEAVAQGGLVRVGMVVACRSMTIRRPSVAVGETLEFEVRRTQGTPDMSQFDGWTRDERGEPVAEIAMTLIHTERPPGWEGGAGPVTFGFWSQGA